VESGGRSYFVRVLYENEKCLSKMWFLLEFVLDIFLSLFSLSVLRFIGACALFVLGHIFGRQTSFKDILNAKSATADTVQIIMGGIVVVAISALWFAL
jgi:hypothetical protein